MYFLFDTGANNLSSKANTNIKELNTWFEINELSREYHSLGL